MVILARDVFYGTAILSALAILYTSLGTLNGRLAGGFSLDNRPWAASVAVFAVSVLGSAVLKVILLRRRKRDTVWRTHPSGRGWVKTDDPVD